VNRRRIAVVAGLLLAVLVLAGCASSKSGSADPKPSQLVGEAASGKYQGFGLDPAQPRPTFTLTDDHGQQFDFGTATAGHPTLLYFGYTNCPDACPETMADVQIALSKIPASVAKKTYVVFVTTDVKRDTAARLREWLGTFASGTKATWVGLRGTQAQIDAAQAAAHVTLASDSGQLHSTQMLLFGPDNYARVSYLLSLTERQELEHDLPVVAKES
jgi:protein SCO1